MTAFFCSKLSLQDSKLDWKYRAIIETEPSFSEILIVVGDRKVAFFIVEVCGSWFSLSLLFSLSFLFLHFFDLFSESLFLCFRRPPIL